MKRLTILMLALLGFAYAEAQQVGGKRPEWVNGYFRDLPNSYIEVSKANGTDRNLARDKAARLVVERRNMASGGEYNVHVSGQTVEVNGDGTLTVKSRVLDEYAEHRGSGDWEVYLLVQTAKNPSFDFEPVSVTDEYPFSARCLVPGMQQLHKGQKTKGVMFIVGEVACVGGIVVAESMRASYEKKKSSTHNASNRMTYSNNADTWGNIRNGFIAAAAAVYVWNIIDALTSKGVRHVETFALAPFATPDSFGLALNINL